MIETEKDYPLQMLCLEVSSALRLSAVKEFDWTIDQEKYIYPNHRGIDHYDRFKEDLALFAEMGFKCYRFRLPGHEFFQMETKVLLTKRD